MNARLPRRIGLLALALGLATLLAGLPAAAAPRAAPAPRTWADQFAGATLGDPWSWIREDPTHWSLSARPGFLRVVTQPGGFGGAAVKAPNLLVQPVPLGSYEIRTRLLFTPQQNFQSAGLIIYQDDGNLVALVRAFCGFGPPACVGNGVYFDQIAGGAMVGGIAPRTLSAPGEVYLRLVRAGPSYSGYISADGSSWELLGTHQAPGLRPLWIGLNTADGGTNAAQIPADFDYFTLIDSTGRLFLPLLDK